MENGTKILIGLGVLVVAGGITYAVTKPKKPTDDGGLDNGFDEKQEKQDESLAGVTKPVFDFLSDLSLKIKENAQAKKEQAEAEALDESLEEDEPDEADADTWMNAKGTPRLGWDWK